jgi:uncharacterized membrane protein/protein-disulfide isomerase
MADEHAEGGTSGRSGGRWLAASLVPVLAALVASAMLAVDYLRPMPVFCSEGGGCDALKHTAIAMPMGIPLPLFGLVGFVAMGIVALVPGHFARVVQVSLSTLAGLVGLSLIVLQFRLGRFCPFCLVTDTSALVALVVAWLRLRRAPSAPGPRVLAYAGGAMLVIAPTVPIMLGFRAAPTPQVIKDELARAPRGVVTVVDFVDFECPFCRMTNPELQAVLAAHPGKVRVVRHQVPLKMHVHAMDAARGACCAETMGKGDAMADALFTAPEEELTRDGCEKIAAQVGLPLDAFRACVADPATDALIEADKAEFQAAGGFALPTLWVGEVQLVGAQPQERIEDAVEAAMARAGS